MLALFEAAVDFLGIQERRADAHGLQPPPSRRSVVGAYGFEPPHVPAPNASTRVRKDVFLGRFDGRYRGRPGEMATPVAT